jgi:hypothetical protein
MFKGVRAGVPWLLDSIGPHRSNTRPGVLPGLLWPAGPRSKYGQVAQLVEQRIENPRVGGSIPPLATTFLFYDVL